MYDDITEFSGQGDILLLGDFNARTCDRQVGLLDFRDDPLIVPGIDPIEIGIVRESADATHGTAYGCHLRELRADLIIYNGISRWPSSSGLTCFPHGGGTSTMDYLIGSYLLCHIYMILTLPPPPLGADHSYLAFSLSGIISAMEIALPMLPHIRVHFDHTLHFVYMRHLTQALESLDEERDLDRASDALVFVIDVASRSFHTT